jgi:hypothetical protein
VSTDSVRPGWSSALSRSSRHRTGRLAPPRLPDARAQVSPSRSHTPVDEGRWPAGRHDEGPNRDLGLHHVVALGVPESRRVPRARWPGTCALGGIRTPNLLIRSPLQGVPAGAGACRPGALTCGFAFALMTADPPPGSLVPGHPVEDPVEERVARTRRGRASPVRPTSCSRSQGRCGGPGRARCATGCRGWCDACRSRSGRSASCSCRRDRQAAPA